MPALQPYATQLTGEVSGMAEVQYKFKKGTPLGGKYGMDITPELLARQRTESNWVSDKPPHLIFTKPIT